MPLPRPRDLSRLPRPLKSPPAPSGDVTFTPVVQGVPSSPVRMYDRGICQGVFTNPAAAAATRRLILRCILWLFLLLPLVPPAGAHVFTAEPPSDASTLRAIAIVEDWQGRRGRAGEIGPWQMMPKTWASYTGTAEERAHQHLDWLKRRFARRGIDPIPFNIALAWNCGFDKTAAGRAPDVSYDYARRVVATLEAGR